MPPERKQIILGPVSPAAPGTLYEQIVDRLKREVSEGRVKPGAALPSFRALAEDLLVSVITVKRAYDELEREGIIYRRQGLGTFVADHGHDRSREAKLAHRAGIVSRGRARGGGSRLETGGNSRTRPQSHQRKIT